MPICPVGHITDAADFCSSCGRQLSVAPQPKPARVCPHCHWRNVPEARFCSTCGFNFSEGVMPPNDLAEALGLTPRAELAPEPYDFATPTVDETTGPLASDDFEDTAAVAASGAPAIPGIDPDAVSWVAEVWVDPDWYALQVTDEPIPSDRFPRLVLLRGANALIGRPSAARNIRPDIDCDPDTACSRRQAQLSFDGTTWLVSDLESANGTYVSSPGAVPTEPITGARKLSQEDSIYVGAWTRITLRPASADESTYL